MMELMFILFTASLKVVHSCTPITRPKGDFYKPYLKFVPWTYGVEEEKRWPGVLCKNGTGYRQSPIDIDLLAAIRDYEGAFIKYGPLNFTNYHKIPVSAFNALNTLQFTSHTKSGSHPLVKGGPLSRNYRLEQVHYHWPSEHSINGHKYPLEIHLVHVRNNLDAESALKVFDGIAILAVFCDLVHGPERPPVSEQEIPHFKHLETPGARQEDIELNVGALLAINQQAYVSYAGSLSSPECNEAVIWIVFEEPLMIPQSLYYALHFVGVGHNNTRTIQPIRDHKVYRTTYRAFLSPLIIDAFEDLRKALRNEFRYIVKLANKWAGRVAKAGQYAIYEFDPKKVNKRPTAPIEIKNDSSYPEIFPDVLFKTYGPGGLPDARSKVPQSGGTEETRVVLSEETQTEDPKTENENEVESEGTERERSQLKKTVESQGSDAERRQIDGLVEFVDLGEPQISNPEREQTVGTGESEIEDSEDSPISRAKKPQEDDAKSRQVDAGVEQQNEGARQVHMGNVEITKFSESEESQTDDSKRYRVIGLGEPQESVQGLQADRSGRRLIDDQEE